MEEEKPTTTHRLYRADSRELSFLKDESVHLILTSPPYWNIKKYNDSQGQYYVSTGYLPPANSSTVTLLYIVLHLDVQNFYMASQASYLWLHTLVVVRS